MVVGGAFLIALYPNSECISQALMDILVGLSVSIVAAGLFTFTIDMRSRLKENMQSVIDAITDHSYLRRLSEGQLTELREKVTHELHTKDAPGAAEELIRIDEKICKLLKKPYYERYDHTVVSYKWTDADFLEKKIQISYKLVNPRGEHRAATEWLGFQVLVLKDNTTDPVKEVTIQCNTDNKGYVDYSDKIDIDVQQLDKKVEFYNACATIIEKGIDKKPERNKNGFKVEFNHSIEVKISYTLITPKEDNNFSKLMRYPTKSLMIDYTDNSPNVELLGRIIGTELEYSDVGVTYRGDNSLRLNSNGRWLLPNEGVMIIASPKKV